MSTVVRCPGDVIREKLKEIDPTLGFTQETLATVIGMSLSNLSGIINGKVGITARTACRLAAAFNTTAEYWMALESAWKLAQYRRVR